MVCVETLVIGDRLELDRNSLTAHNYTNVLTTKWIVVDIKGNVVVTKDSDGSCIQWLAVKDENGYAVLPHFRLRLTKRQKMEMAVDIMMEIEELQSEITELQAKVKSLLSDE